jgi:hypothetical protein
MERGKVSRFQSFKVSQVKSNGQDNGKDNSKDNGRGAVGGRRCFPPYRRKERGAKVGTRLDSLIADKNVRARRLGREEILLIGARA